MIPWTRTDQAILDAAPSLPMARWRLRDRHPASTVSWHWYATQHGQRPERYGRERRELTPDERAVAHTLAWVMDEALRLRVRPDWGAVLDALREVGI